MITIWSIIWSPGWWIEPLWKIGKSVGMIIPNIWAIKNVPNHQPDSAALTVFGDSPNRAESLLSQCLRIHALQGTVEVLPSWGLAESWGLPGPLDILCSFLFSNIINIQIDKHW